MADQYNPIQTVDGAEVPCPSKYKWGIYDISASDAGRTEDGKMHKMRVGRKRKLELEWQNQDISVIHDVLVAFAPEYVTVKCLDPLEGGWATKTFYSGDQGAPAYNTRLGIWTLAFNVIEQ